MAAGGQDQTVKCGLYDLFGKDNYQHRMRAERRKEMYKAKNKFVKKNFMVRLERLYCTDGAN